MLMTETTGTERPEQGEAALTPRATVLVFTGFVQHVYLTPSQKDVHPPIVGGSRGGCLKSKCERLHVAFLLWVGEKRSYSTHPHYCVAEKGLRMARKCVDAPSVCQVAFLRMCSGIIPLSGRQSVDMTTCDLSCQAEGYS